VVADLPSSFERSLDRVTSSHRQEMSPSVTLAFCTVSVAIELGCELDRESVGDQKDPPLAGCDESL